MTAFWNSPTQSNSSAGPAPSTGGGWETWATPARATAGLETWRRRSAGSGYETWEPPRGPMMGPTTAIAQQLSSSWYPSAATSGQFAEALKTIRKDWLPEIRPGEGASNSGLITDKDDPRTRPSLTSSSGAPLLNIQECVNDVLGRMSVIAASDRTAATLNFDGTDVVTLNRPTGKFFIDELDAVTNAFTQQENRRAEILVQADTHLPFWANLLSLRASRFPYTMALAEIVWHCAIQASQQMKAVFECARPSDYSFQVQPMIEVPWHSSFQSGHATEAHALKTLFIALVAESKCDKPAQMFLTGRLRWLAKRIAENRTVAGLHFNADNRAGHILGELLGNVLLARIRGEKQFAPGDFSTRITSSGTDPSYDAVLTDKTDCFSFLAAVSLSEEKLGLNEYWRRALAEWK